MSGWTTGSASITERALSKVQVDGLALLKIAKHCKEALPTLVTGQLLGLDIGQTLEVTNCFPFPTENGEDEEGGTNYQLEMMRCLREVNIDNNTVGWYQSTYLGSYQTTELIETFLNYRENIRRCVCIVYDPTRSTQGQLSATALRLAEPFMDLYKQNAGVLSTETVAAMNLQWHQVFVEVPMAVTNSALAATLMSAATVNLRVSQADFDRLQLSDAPNIERTLSMLGDCIDDVTLDLQRLQQHHRQAGRQLAAHSAWLAKRRAENVQRKAVGQEQLPEEDPNAFKPSVEPPRLDALLISNQINTYCGQLHGTATQGLQKLHLLKVLS